MITGPVRGVLLGEGRYAGKAYFFKGADYWRYDLRKDYGEVDYPQPLSAWKLPPAFANGIDACLAGRRGYKGKAYFFKGPWYVSYEWKREVVSELKPVTTWDKLRQFPFPNGFDAALNGQGRYEGKAYFFKGDRYARYDWDDDRFDLLDQKVSSWKLGTGFESSITACCNGDAGGLTSNPTAYFFKDDSYVKYDWKTDRAVDGYPMSIAAGWPSGCAVWGEHAQAPTNVCDDPRLDAGKARIAFPHGTLRGQAGWQVRVKFDAIKDLADKLSDLTIPDWYGDPQAGKARVPAGRITRLGLNAHGHGGAFGANGPNAQSDSEQWITDMRVIQQGPLRSQLERIRPMLAPGAPILLLGCEAGQTVMGNYLLIGLSQLFAGHPVTAFTSIGYAGGPNAKRPNEPCSEAGMRDTSFLEASRSPKEEANRVAAFWGDLKTWPWASDASPRAKTALNGEIVRRPGEDRPPL